MVAVLTRPAESIAPVDSGLPYGIAALPLRDSASIPNAGIMVYILRGPIYTRAALAVVADSVVIRPLAPLMPTMRLKREEIAGIDLDNGPLLSFRRSVICIRRVKGGTTHLTAAHPTGVDDETEYLARFLKAWWTSDSSL